LSYRGISLASAVHRIYCRIINSRLSDWVEKNNVLVDEQNRFRRKRGTIDHISSLVDIVETRLRFKQSTFADFIDFSKAYDLINRDKFWERLKTYGVSGNLMKAIKSLYASVSSCVRVNSHQSFEVNCGLRQGCILSPVLFNLHINDLALYLKALAIGIKVGDEKIYTLLYADDIVLLA